LPARGGINELEWLKEMGVKDPQKFIRYQMLENNNINYYSSPISFNFVIGIVK